MHLESQTVAQGVTECLREPPGGYDIAGQGIALSGRHSRAQMLDRAALGCLDQCVDRALPVVRPGAYHNSAGEVGTVSVDLRTEVKQEQLPHRQRAVTRARMG
jgi:hypothetical protein